MVDYAKTLSFPKVNIGDIRVPQLILGHLPFVGESYQGFERNLELIRRFSNIENTIRVLVKGFIEYGITVVGAVPANEGRMASLFLEAVRETERRIGLDVALIPCLRIPLTIKGEPVDDYRRWLTYYNVEKVLGEDVLKKYLEDPVLLCRQGWKESFQNALAKLDFYSKKDFEKLQVDFDKIEQAMSSLTEFNILFLELGSEIDFLVMAGRLDLVAEVVDRLRDSFKSGILLGVHHAGITIPILDRSGIEFDGYLTPINKLGVMMFPAQDLALKAVENAKKPVVAVKPLAAGRIPPKEAFDYLYKKLNIKTCMVGVGSERELEEDASIALKILSTLT